MNINNDFLKFIVNNFPKDLHLTMIKQYKLGFILLEYVKTLDYQYYQTLKKIVAKQRVKNNIMRQEIYLLNKIFHQNKLNVAHIKGIALYDDLYQDEPVINRKINDIDILVSNNNIKDILNILGDVGYIVAATHEKVNCKLCDKVGNEVQKRLIHYPVFTKYHDEIDEYIDLDCHITLVHNNIHKEKITEVFLSHTVNTPSNDGILTLLDINDRLIHLILHYSKEYFRNSVRWFITGERVVDSDYRMRLDLLYDIALFINKYNENINWQYIISFVKKIEAYDEFSKIISLLKKICPDILFNQMKQNIDWDIYKDNRYNFKWLDSFYSLKSCMSKTEEILLMDVGTFSKYMLDTCIHNKEKYYLEKEYYIYNYSPKSGIVGQFLAETNTHKDCLGQVKLHKNKYRIFIFIKPYCKIDSIQFTMGTLEYNEVFNSHLIKGSVQINNNNCVFKNGYVEINIKNCVSIEDNRVIIELPMKILGIEEYRVLLFDIGFPQMDSEVQGNLLIKKYSSIDVSKKGFDNCFQYSPELLTAFVENELNR